MIINRGGSVDQRNTRQKYVVLKIIRDSKDHPTIAEICERVQNIDSSIGQATVYRNVKRFLDEGKIYQIKTKSGIDRYDYYTDHIHFECLNCGDIIDIMDDELLTIIKNRYKNRTEDIIDYNIMIDGFCEKCK